MGAQIADVVHAISYFTRIGPLVIQNRQCRGVEVNFGFGGSREPRCQSLQIAAIIVSHGEIRAHLHKSSQIARKVVSAPLRSRVVDESLSPERIAQIGLVPNGLAVERAEDSVPADTPLEL